MAPRTTVTRYSRHVCPLGVVDILIFFVDMATSPSSPLVDDAVVIGALTQVTAVGLKKCTEILCPKILQLRLANNISHVEQAKRKTVLMTATPLDSTNKWVWSKMLVNTIVSQLKQMTFQT